MNAVWQDMRPQWQAGKHRPAAAVLWLQFGTRWYLYLPVPNGSASLPWTIIAFGLPLFVAPFVGSFLGVLIRRLPVGRGVVWSRSACDSCAQVLGPLEMVPIASFLALRGRCRNCGARIARMHLAVELAAVLVPLSIMGAGLLDLPTLWVSCVLGWTLLALAWIDATSFLLPDALTLPLLAAGLAQCRWLSPDLLADHAAAAIAAWLGLWALSAAYRHLRHRDGLGQGDLKLFAAGAAWTGLAALPQVLLIAALLGILMAAAAMLVGRRLTMSTRVPFGPALAAAIWIVFLWQS